MKLYSYWRSSCSYRVRIVLAHKGLDYEYVPVHLVKDGGQQNAPAFLEKNSLGQVPVLELNDGRRLTQSLAIMAYIEKSYAKPAMLPDDVLARALAWERIEIINAGIQPLQNIGLMKKVKALAPDTDMTAWARDVIATGFDALEPLLAETAETYAMGNDVTFVDALLVPQVYNARRFEVDMSKYPTIVRLDEACNELHAFQAAHPDAQPDAETA